MADHDQLITACGRILSGFYLLARRPDLARRIRLSLRPRGRTQNGGAPSDPASTGDQPSASPDAEPAEPVSTGGEPESEP